MSKPKQIDAFEDEQKAREADKIIKEANAGFRGELAINAKLDKLQEDMDRLIKRLM